MKHNAAVWKNKEEFAAMEREALIESIQEMDSTIRVLKCAIKSAIDDPENWRVHLNAALATEQDQPATTPQIEQGRIEGMTREEKLIDALRNILADCEVAQERRTTTDFDFATYHAIEYARAALTPTEVEE